MNKKAAKQLNKELNRISVEEVTDYAMMTASISEMTAHRKQLNESLKKRLEAGAEIPTNGPYLLVYDKAEAPSLSWRDIAYNLCVQIVRLPMKFRKQFQTNAGEVTPVDEVAALNLMDQLDKENPREPQPKLTVKPNVEWQKLQDVANRLKGKSI